jgi:adenylate cyclase class 2
MKPVSDPSFPDGLEIEVKFYVADLSRMRDAILSIGAREMGKTFEDNIRFDDRGRTLAENRCLLRLRMESDGKVTLTFKAPPFQEDPRFKVFREHEVRVDDAGRMTAILEGLGYHPVQRYEKWRDLFDLNGVTLCLDELPFGTFLEIEGEKNGILHASRALGLDWESRITENYLSLFERIRRDLALSFTDVTFDHFKGIRFSPEWFFSPTN